MSEKTRISKTTAFAAFWAKYYVMNFFCEYQFKDCILLRFSIFFKKIVKYLIKLSNDYFTKTRTGSDSNNFLIKLPINKTD